MLSFIYLLEKTIIPYIHTINGFYKIFFLKPTFSRYNCHSELSFSLALNNLQSREKPPPRAAISVAEGVAVCIRPLRSPSPLGGHAKKVKKKKSSHHITMVTSWPVVALHRSLKLCVCVQRAPALSWSGSCANLCVLTAES